MKKFAPFADNVLPWLTCVSMIAALAMIFLYVPTERNLGVVQRIFYYHLPSAWNAFLGFFIVAGASASYLWKGERRADLIAHTSAEVGMLFCTLFIVTGSVWAKASWGVWWTWDPRLTMTIVMWVVYASYVLLRQIAGDNEQVARYAAVLGIVGALNIPLIYIAILLPLLIPLLLAAVQITTAILTGEDWTGIWLRVLVPFDVIFVVAGWLLFPQVVYE